MSRENWEVMCLALGDFLRMIGFIFLFKYIMENF
jgi:hypothetical protein